MCGFAGFWMQGGWARDAAATLAAMTETLRHRGPDDEGYWTDPGAGVGLGHRRLAILDLSPEGRQPMASASRRYQIVYNGEVYNFAELRRELERDGARFRGHSDTEVMLAAFERWGIPGAVERFAGMFAFAAWDAAERALHLVRDRLGEKPLYYGWQGDTLLFGSELRALRAFPGWSGEIDRGALALYLRHGCVPAPYAIYSGVRKLLPGTIETVRPGTAGAAPEARRYWSASAMVERGRAEPLAGDDTELVEAADALLRRVVRREMRADVPVGAFLSGGIDSSTVVALMQAESSRPVRTFTIGFHERAFDEAGHARAVAAHLGTDHVELYLTPAELLATVPRMPRIYDEPFGDSSQIPTFLVAQLARRDVTVSLSGDGGDELFGGYAHYFRAERLWRRMRLVPAGVRRRVAAGLGRGTRVLAANGNGGDLVHRVARAAGMVGAESAAGMYRGIMSHCRTPSDLLPGVVEPATAFTLGAAWPPADRLLRRLMHLDTVTFLPDDILVKVDRATMSVGLESRAPLLDHEVAEFAWRLPADALVRGGEGKWLLRRVLGRYVPGDLVDRPKQGFAVPIDRWLAGPLRSWADDLLDSARLRREAHFDADAVSAMWRRQRGGMHQWHDTLWNVLMFELWLDAQ